MKTKFHLFLVTILGGSTAVKLLSRDTRAENMMCLVTVPLAAPSVQRRKKNNTASYVVQTGTLVFTADLVSEHVLNMEKQTYGTEP